MGFIKKIVANQFSRRDSEVKKTSLVLFANIFSQGISFIAIMLITKALTVEDYAKFAVLNTVLSLSTDLADMGMNGAITRFVAQYHEKDEYTELGLIAYAIKRKLLNSVLVIGILLLMSNFIAEYFVHDSSYTIYVVLISFCVGFMLLSSLNKAIFQGRESYVHYLISTIVDGGVYFVLIFILYFNRHLSVSNIIFVTLIRIIVSMIFSAFLAKISIKTLFYKIKKNDSAKQSFNNFGNWMVLWAIFANLQSRADVILLTQLTTNDQVSYYDLANKCTKPILMVVSSYAQVLNPLLVKTQTQKGLKEKFVQIIKVISVVTAGLIICTVLCGPAIKLFIGVKYTASIVPLRIMLLSLIFYVWTVPYNSMLYAFNKPHVFAIAAGIGLLATIVGDLIFLGRFGAIGAAFTYCLAQIISFVVAFFAYRIVTAKSDVQEKN